MLTYLGVRLQARGPGQVKYRCSEEGCKVDIQSTKREPIQYFLYQPHTCQAAKDAVKKTKVKEEEKLSQTRLEETKGMQQLPPKHTTTTISVCKVDLLSPLVSDPEQQHDIQESKPVEMIKKR